MKSKTILIKGVATLVMCATACCGGQQTEAVGEEASGESSAEPPGDVSAGQPVAEDEDAGVPDEPTEPPCQGMDCFGDYRPKTSPDTIADYAPQVIGRVDAVAAADLEGLPALIHALADVRQQADENPGTVREGNVILGADPQEYVPSEQELLEHAIGDRIAQVIADSDPKQVAAALKKAAVKKRKLTYGRIDFWHVDVMGSGRFFYASKPADTEIRLPR